MSRDCWCGALPCGRETLRRRRAPGRPRPGRWAGGRTHPSPGTARPQTLTEKKSINENRNQSGKYLEKFGVNQDTQLLYTAHVIVNGRMGILLPGYLQG